MDPVIGFEQQDLTVLESAGEIDVCVILLNNEALEAVVALVIVNDGNAIGTTKFEYTKTLLKLNTYSLVCSMHACMFVYMYKKARFKDIL